MRTPRWLALGSAPAAAALLLAGALPALAAGAGSIDHVESSNGTEQVLFSIAGLPDTTSPDLSSVQVTVGGAPVDATATPASGSAQQVGRVAVLVLDVSKSMHGAKFDEAKQAALAFIDKAPADVEIGLVTFAGTVHTVDKPTTDRKALARDIGKLKLLPETRLYDAILAALAAAGKDGQRQVLVLSDGLDTTGKALSKVTGAVTRSGTRVDVVSLGQSVDPKSPLSKIAASGQGTLVNASDPKALTTLFSDEAQALASQILITFPVPTAQAGSDANITVNLTADATTYSDAAFVSFGDAKPTKGAEPGTTPLAAPQAGFQVSQQLLFAAVGGLALVVVVGLAALFGIFRREEKMTLEQRMAGYQNRDSKAAAGKAPVNVKQSALALAQKAINGGGLEAKLDRRLDSAGVALRPAEWVLTHAAVAVGAAFVGFLLSSGSPLVTVFMLILGAVIPWVYLGFKQSRRIKAFNAQLAETLQLMSGGLSAGLSLVQSIDTIVREGTEPVAGEFRRALVEARLGVEIEDALDGVAERMGSADFQWVVMAVRIQREVGGNLSELLVTVAATLREREYLRRQVQTLSAEGRLSAWILCGLPPVFVVYLALTRGDYLSPMFHTTIGWVMVAFASMLMTVGAVWMSKVVKVEV